jgi:N-alpha-acetyltransferase 35, NatC auxiliary subunit
MEIFRQRAAEPYLDIFRIFCQNRCRVRRTLCHSIQEWDILQADVEEIDLLLQVNMDEKPLQTERGDMGYAMPLSSWAYLYKLRQMEWIVQLGFELSVYQPDELAGMYWYLNYLAKTRAQHGDRIKAFTMRALETARHRKAGPGPAAQEREFLNSLSYVRVTMLDAACTWEFADGLCCLYTVLSRLGLTPIHAAVEKYYRYQTPSSKSRVSDDSSPGVASPTTKSSVSSRAPSCTMSLAAHRYEVRMRPFSSITLPPLPSFEEHSRATTQPETPISELLRYADTAVGGARKGYEALSKLGDQPAFAVHCHGRWVETIKKCLKATIAAGVAIETVRRIVQEEDLESMTGATHEVNLEGEEGDAVKGGGTAAEKFDAKLRVVQQNLKVEMPAEGTSYHEWWLVPKITRLH